jgi:hypothetical protein
MCQSDRIQEWSKLNDVVDNAGVRKQNAVRGNPVSCTSKREEEEALKRKTM